MSYESFIAGLSPIGGWPLSTNANDSVGVNNGNPTNVTFGQPGIIPGSSGDSALFPNFVFPGASIAIAAPNITSPFSFVCALRTADTTGAIKIIFNPIVGIGAYFDGAFPAVTDGETNLQASSGYADGNPHLFALTFDGTNGTLYMDGTSVGSHALTASAPSEFEISGPNQWIGNLQGAYLFNYALTSANVTAIYTAFSSGGGGSPPPPPPSLVAGTLATNGTVLYNSVPLAIATDSGGTAPYSNQLERSLHGAGSYSNIGSPVNGATATFNDGTPAPSTEYDYRVAATDAASDTATSNILTVTTPASPPPPPPPYTGSTTQEQLSCGIFC